MVSRTLDGPTDLTIGFDTKAWMIDREGKEIKVAKGDNSFVIEEGDAMIFRFRK